MAAKRRKNKRSGPRQAAPDAAAAPAKPSASASSAPAATGTRSQRVRARKAAAADSAAAGFDATTLLLGLVALGVALTAYLTWAKLSGGELVACGTGSACDIVGASRWSELFGVPLALFGLLTYALTGALVWRSRRRPAAWVQAMFVAGLGVAMSAYLTAISVLEIGVTCGYCLTSAALITSIFVVLALFRPQRLRSFEWRSFAPSTGLVAAILVVGLHMHWSGAFDAAAGPEKAYLKGLAMHLEETGAKFYGAYWCPACQRQKGLFEASAERLPYVECSPGGRGTPMSAACRNAAVQDFPTWIVGGRRFTGVQQPTTLAELSGYKDGG